MLHFAILYCSVFMGWSRINYTNYKQGSYRPWKVLESPGIKMLKFTGLEVLEKSLGPVKPWQSPRIQMQ